MTISKILTPISNIKNSYIHYKPGSIELLRPALSSYFSLTKANKDYGDLEKTCEKLPSLTVPQVPALANYGQLSLDLSIDKVQLNQQVHRYGYVWWDHLQGKKSTGYYSALKNIFRPHINQSFIVNA